MFGILKNKSIYREVEEKYKVKIHVNHKMTHICKFKPRKAFQEGKRDTLGELLEEGQASNHPLDNLHFLSFLIQVYPTTPLFS
jgi:hypothetical protein